jgi:hypothetical protein
MPTTLRTGSIALFALALFVTGCAQPFNPSFPVTTSEARADLARMRSEPMPLARPLVIIGGIADPGFTPLLLSNRLDSVAMSDGSVAVPVGACITFNSCRDKVIAAVEKVYPSGDPDATVEVDVIGLSMGGMVARYAALPRENGKRLRIARLFTISTPMRGSESADYLPAWSPNLKDYPVIRSLRPGSDFLKLVNAREPEYPIFSYVRLHDFYVPAENAALPGRVAWWVPTPFPGSPHEGAMFDPRILADIARRLRYETPLTLNPPARLPPAEPSLF